MRQFFNTIIDITLNPRPTTVKGRLLYVLLFPLWAVIALTLMGILLVVCPIFSLVQWIMTGKDT